MMVNRSFSSVLTVAAVAMLLSSCAKEEAFSGLEPSAEAKDRSGPQVISTPEVSKSASNDSDQRDVGGLLDKRLVFFDYDKSAIRSEDLAVVNTHIDFLVINRGKSVVLEGHADERGSNEYNLALGQRRSDAIRELMVSGGVLADQLETISFGEERPRAFGSTESAWAENRRVQIIYTDE